MKQMQNPQARGGKPVRMIGFDLDGTILNREKQLTPRTRQALLRAAAAGVVVLPATGRQLAGIPPEVLGLPGIRYALSSNGAHVFEVATRKPVFADCFDEATALSVLRLGKTFDGLLALYMGGEGYTEGRDPAFLEGTVSPSVLHYLRTTRHTVPSLEQLVTGSAEPMEKISIHFASGQERARALAAFAARGDVTVTASVSTNIEINTATANKGAALLALARLLGIPQQQVMAIGDSFNDLAMLRCAGHAVAMGNAVQEAKAAAHHVTATCDEDGAARAIEAVLPPERP